MGEDDRLPAGVPKLIALLLLSTFLVILNETIMGVALPRLMVELDITASTGQWLTTAFMLTMAVVIPMTGSILDRFSTRTVFMTAASLFTVGTLLAAAAPGFSVLLLGRVVQAAGTALLLPLLMTTVMTFVPEARRGRMMGLISIVIAVAPAIGPTVSGLVLSSLGWRWMFLIMLPPALIALILGIVLVRNVSVTRAVRFDLLSMSLSALAFGGLIFGLSSIGESSEGHALMPPAIPIAVGAAALVAFVFRQIRLQRSDSALMDLRPFATRTFTTATALVLISMGALFGTLILLPLFLQNVLGLDTLQTGLLLLPGGLVLGVLGPVVGRLFDRYGPKPLVIPGALALSSALWLMTTLDRDSTVSTIITVHMLLCGALAFMLTPLMTSALGSLPTRLYSHGSAIVSTGQQLAGAAGTALCITLMSTGTAAAVRDGMDPVAAQASGVHTAFLAAAAVSVLSVIGAFFVRNPSKAATGELPVLH
ncbi:MAG: family efflux transporter permease subunit [Mycobacterium sp.]|jgi:DHA2 family lincomycin resistance protein-like MFS transporter|nr:family efflux transporter permease subunit [Mycobacterium sp.]